MAKRKSGQQGKMGNIDKALTKQEKESLRRKEYYQKRRNMEQKEIRQSYDKIMCTSSSESEGQNFTSDNEVNDVAAEEPTCIFKIQIMLEVSE